MPHERIGRSGRKNDPGSFMDLRSTVRVLLLLGVGLFVGCSSTGEVRLWPVLDVHTPPAATGKQVKVLWPVVEVDTTGEKAAWAVRPIVSYNGPRGRGSFLWPFGSFATRPDSALKIWPLYSWKAWDEERESGQHTLVPLGGYWHNERAQHWMFGPALYYRQKERETKRRVDGMAIPPWLYDRDDDSSFFLLLNYYRHQTPDSVDHVWFPFVWWSDHGDPEGRRTKHRELFPLVGVQRVYGQDEVRRTRVRVAWPLAHFEWGPEANWNQILFYLLSWRHHQGQLAALNVLPFFSYSPSHFSLPFLGYCRWDSTQEGSQPGKSGWAAWPFVTHSQTFAAEGATGTRLTQDRWSYLAGLIGHIEEPEISARTYFWPLFDRRQQWTREPERRLVHRSQSYLLGLVQADQWPLADHRQVSPLYPLISYESGPDVYSHRFWPLYRYEARGDHGEQKSFHALAELLTVRRGQEISAGPQVLLRPFSYQSTGDGDHDLRLFWKLFESRRVGDDRLWGLHPLVYSRSRDDSSTFLILGGLVGSRSDGERRSIRVLWLFDIPTS